MTSVQALGLDAEPVDQNAILDAVSGNVTFALKTLQQQQEWESLSAASEDIMMVVTLSLEGSQSSPAVGAAHPVRTSNP